MTSGADPFSVLSKSSLIQNQDSSLAQQASNQIKRYRPGIKPEFEVDSNQSSDSDNDFDMFSDNKTMISKFTNNTKTTMGTKAGLDNIEQNRSRIIKKNFDSKQMKLLNKEIQELSSGLGIKSMAKKTSAVVTKDNSGVNEEMEAPVEKKLKIASDAVVQVVSRRAGRGQIISTETQSQVIEEDKNFIMKDDNEDLVARKARVMVDEPNKVAEDVQKVEDSSDTEEYSEGEDESDDESHELVNVIKRPVFIKKEDRFMQEKEIEDELKAKLEEKRLKESLKEQNKQIIIESKAMRDPVPETDIFGSDNELPNDDEDDEDTAYTLWRQRELYRLRRDREEREREFLEKERTERRRLMTDEERAKEDKKIGKYKQAEKSSLQFMQKYYHTGIFGDKSDPLFTRDYNIGVGSDNYDKSSLPKAMQVRRGQEHKKGRSKYTHLGDQDTTNFEPEFGVHEDLKNKFLGKMGGYKSSNTFDRPTKRQ